MANLLITGGAGFVGTNLIAHLSSAGDHSIRVLDNERLGKREHIEGLGVEFIAGDIRDKATVERSMRGIDAVVHLAADTRVMDSIADPTYNFECNVVGSFNILMAARAAGVKRIVNASTGGAILGEAPAPVHENMVAAPLAPYGASKLSVEGYISAFAGSYGLSAASLRFSNIYGPRSFHKGSVVAHFFKRILAGEELLVYGDGSQVRDYLFVIDLVEGIRRAIDSGAGGVFQLGSGRPTTINELIAAMREVVAGDARIDVRHEDFRAGEIHTTWCDITKARQVFDFDPATPLNDGLAQTWAWFRQQAGYEIAAE